MFWNVISVVIGLLTGSMVNMALILVSGTIWPMPAGLDPDLPGAFAEYVASLPTAAMGFIMFAHLAQAGVGGGVAAGLGRSHRVWLAAAVGLFTVIGSVVNLMVLPAPAWMWSEVVLVPLVAVAGGRVATQLFPMEDPT